MAVAVTITFTSNTTTVQSTEVIGAYTYGLNGYHQDGNMGSSTCYSASEITTKAVIFGVFAD